MGSRIAMGAVVALIIGLAAWAALPSREQTPAGDVSARIDACLAAQQQVAELRRTRGRAPEGGPSDQAVVSRACAPLFREPGCQKAQTDFDTPPPGRRSVAIIEACARGYCGQLPAPKPSACDHLPTADEQVLDSWTELARAILRHDLGDAAATRVYPQR